MTEAGDAPGSLVGAAFYDFLKRLLRPHHRFEQNPPEVETAFDFHLHEEGRRLEFHLRTNDPDQLRIALDGLPEASRREVAQQAFDRDSNEWVPPS